MRRTGIRIAMLVLLTSVCALGAAEVAEKKVTLKASELPAAIKKAIKEAFPQGKILVVEKEVEGEDPGQYDVSIESKGKVYEVEISAEGTLTEAKEVGEAAEEGDEGSGSTKAGGDGDVKWTDDFQVDERSFATTGKNRFFILKAGHRIVLETKSAKVIITVLDKTKKIGDVVTRVVEEREFEDGELVEVSRNFFAICKGTGDVFYFGEEVDDYKDGKIVGHGGAWRADEKGCRAGIIMPGTVMLGARHYQEIAPNAMDRAEVIADDVTMKTPAGTFRKCIRVKETSPLEPGGICYKTYAPGIGLIQDEELLLTAYSKGGGEGGTVKDQPKAARRTARKRSSGAETAKVEKGGGEAVTLKDLPRAVRRTAKKRAGGGEITEIEKKETDDGIVYEIEVTEDGRQRDILISAEGKYLGTQAEDEDAEKAEGNATTDDEEDGDNEGDDDDAGVKANG